MDRRTRPPRQLAALALAAIAAILLGGVLGAALIGPGGSPPPVATSPTPTPTTTPGASTTPAGSPTPTPGAVVRQRVYFARDQLPPFGADVETTLKGPQTPESRIRARFEALATASAPPRTGNEFASSRTNPTVRDVVIDGDLARVDWNLPNGDWGVGGTAGQIGLLQQIVYTATEEPGIRRVLITENGGRPTTVMQGHGLAIETPLTREDVFGYAFKGSEVTSIENPGMDVAQEVKAWMATNGLLTNGQLYTAGRVSVDVREVTPPAEGPPPTNAPERRLDPTFKAELAPVTKVCTEPSCVGGKWTITLTLPRARFLASPQPTVTVDFIGGPIRGVDGQVVSPSCGPGASACPPFTLITIYVDDARPWRVSVEPTGTGTARINVDIGGRPSFVNRNIAVYGLTPGDPVPRSFSVSGAARVFEANVAWRLRDASEKPVAQGNVTASVGTSPVWGTFEAKVEVPSGVTGRVTLEVFWGSPKDGSDQDVVRIPLSVR
jgi:hypothetical protein